VTGEKLERANGLIARFISEIVAMKINRLWRRPDQTVCGNAKINQRGKMIMSPRVAALERLCARRVVRHPMALPPRLRMDTNVKGPDNLPAENRLLRCHV